MGAAIEGTIDGIPSMGFSLCNYDPEADFSSAARYVYKIISDYLENLGMDSFCLNVNIPAVSYELINGIKICRQTMGYWEEEFEARHDPSRKTYYWLTGRYVNQEPGEKDTDQWALKHNYVAVVPITIDMTSRNGMKSLEKWGLEQENLEVQEKFQQNK
jgi:5'-nucleotidase